MASTGRPDGGGNGAEPPVRRYANHLAVAFSLSEVEFRFGQHSSAWDQPLIHSLVVSSPVDLLAFGRTIQQTILDYERRFGRIPGGSQEP